MATSRNESTAIKDGRARVMLSFTPEEIAAVDKARGSIPAATWCRELVLRALAEPKP